MSNLTESFKKTSIYQELVAATLKEAKRISIEVIGCDVYQIKLVVNNGITDIEKIRRSDSFLRCLKEAIGEKKFNYYCKFYMKGKK